MFVLFGTLIVVLIRLILYRIKTHKIKRITVFVRQVEEDSRMGIKFLQNICLTLSLKCLNQKTIKLTLTTRKKFR